MARRRSRLLVAGSLLLVGLNLRPAIVALSPLLPEIRRSTGLSTTLAGLLTTVPLVCFGAFAFLAPRLSRRFGPERLLVAVLATLVGATCLRLVPGTWALFLGTTLAGAAIAVGNVLLPGLVKRDFPDHVPLMTGLYAMTLSGGAALASGITVPIGQASGLGWRPVLALWGVLATVALVAVALQALGAAPRNAASGGEPAGGTASGGEPAGGTASGGEPAGGTASGGEPAGGTASGGGLAGTAPVRGLWRDRVAWAVTGYMGAQSLVFYAAVAWLPSDFQAHGFSAGTAGWLLSYASLVSVPACLGAPLLGRHLRSDRPLVAGAAAVISAGLVGIAFDPRGLVYLWLTLAGIGMGASLSLALGFMAHRAPDAAHAAQLSTLAQGGGYLLAALGPVTLGAVHDLAGEWAAPMLVLAALLLPEVLVGNAASRDRTVRSSSGLGAPGLPRPPLTGSHVTSHHLDPEVSPSCQ